MQECQDSKNICCEDSFLPSIHRASVTSSVAPGTGVKPEHSKGARPTHAVFVFMPCCKSHSDWIFVRLKSSSDLTEFGVPPGIY